MMADTIKQCPRDSQVSEKVQKFYSVDSTGAPEMNELRVRSAHGSHLFLNDCIQYMDKYNMYKGLDQVLYNMYKGLDQVLYIARPPPAPGETICQANESRRGRGCEHGAQAPHH